MWAQVFKCPVYLSDDDRGWLVEEDPCSSDPVRRFIVGQGAELEIPGNDGQKTGAKAIKVGGHFPGSLVLLHDSRLLVADTIMPTPAGVGDWGARGRPKGMNSFAFMWSYPNVRSPPFLLQPPKLALKLQTNNPPQMIPLPPPTLAAMWRVLCRYTFSAVHGGFPGLDIEGEDVKKRVWESMGIQIGAEGWQEGSGFAEEFRLVVPM